MGSEWMGFAIAFVVIAIVALAIGPMLIRLMRHRRMTREVLQTGVGAIATIVSTWDTGVRINDNPRVRMRLWVQPPVGVPFHSEATMTVSIVHLAAFQPGAQVNVKYDPNNPTRIAIVDAIGWGASPAGATAGLMNEQQAAQMLTLYQTMNEELLRTGVEAPARVLQYLPLGINVNGPNAAVNLIVEVQPREGNAFTAQAQGNVIAPSGVPKFQPGQMVTVRYNPGDLTKVAVQRPGL